MVANGATHKLLGRSPHNDDLLFDSATSNMTKKRTSKAGQQKWKRNAGQQLEELLEPLNEVSENENIMTIVSCGRLGQK